jgi:aspartyl-tRNA(Asn)/glutamyl-tRNA(Gln) amidotransferase subunit C
MTGMINESVLTKVARLARLGLTPDEVVAMTTDIEKIIEYFEQIRNLDLADVEPMTHAVAITLQSRPDQINPTQCPTALLPYQKHHHFYVPAVLE